MFEKDGLGDFWSQTVGKVAGNVAAETGRVVHKTAAEIGRAAPIKAIAKTAVGKEIARVGTRVTKTVVQPLVTAATHGDIIKATALLNPAAIGLKSVGANKSIVDAANALTPVSATEIQDPDLKKKVLGAYTIAAVVGGGMIASSLLGPAAGTTASGAEIPGTGMTAAQMSAAGATDTQIAEITAAANAPGGIMSGANAALLTDIGGTVPSGVTVVENAAQVANIANQANQGLTAAQVAQGAQTAATVAQAGSKINQALNQGEASGSAAGSMAVNEAGIFGIPTNYILIGGGIVTVILALVLKSKKKKSE